MRIITHDDIVKLSIDPMTCYQWMKEALAIKDEVFLEAKTSMKPKPGVFFTSMPCLIPQEHVYGLKMVSRIPGRLPALNSTINLYDSESGAFLAVMDCDWITAMRTGAVAAFSIMKLAKQNFQTIACIGLGNTCLAVLTVLLPLLKNRKLTIKLKQYKDQAEKLIQRFQKYDQIDFVVVNDDEALFRGNDVILSCVTTMDHNMAKDEWFDEGVLVVPVHTMGFQNCDQFFDKFVYDDYDHVKNFKYFHAFCDKLELKDLLTHSYRTNEQERIIAYNVGIALFDLYFAIKIFHLILQFKEVPFLVNTQKEWL